MLSRIFYQIALPCDTMIPPDRSITRHEVEKIYGAVIDLPETRSYAVLVPAMSKQVILYSHGNSSTLSRLSGFLTYMRDQLEINVCAYEFPARPTAEDVNQTALETYLYLCQCYGSENIILVGKSIGTGPTAWLSRRYSNQLTVLVSPYVSLRLLLHETYVPGLGEIIPDSWDNLEELRHTVSSLLIIHGQEDMVIPHHHALILYDQAISPDKTFAIIPGEGHELRRKEVDILAKFI